METSRVTAFMPHGMCLQWQPTLLAAHVVADALIAIAYFSIPLFLIWLVRKRGDLPFSWLFAMFAVFILSCGTTHILSIWVLWHPDYWLEAAVKWVTAVASVLTATMMIPLTPKILSIRSPQQAEALLAQLQREHSIATTFQNASLPQLPDSVPGLDIHAIYCPAVRDLEIGGDWYDAVCLIDGRVLISIGDVAGKGLPASVVMSKVRQAIRVAAQIQIDPAAILDAADRALKAEYPDVFATAFVGIFDRMEGLFSYASAGHPGPVLRFANGSVEHLDGSSLPLGLRMREESALSYVHAIHEDSLFVFYTDGLVESTRDLAAGQQRLIDAISHSATDVAADPAEHIYTTVVDEEPRDDIAILTVRVTPLTEVTDYQTWIFDVRDAVAAEKTRRELLTFLAARGVNSDDLDVAELVYAELIGNVVRYAPGEVKVRTEWYYGRSLLHVFDDGPGFQHLPGLPRDVYSESGRGLYLIATLTEDFHISRRPGRGSHARVVLQTMQRRQPLHDARMPAATTSGLAPTA